jgi:hypothetical protein
MIYGKINLGLLKPYLDLPDWTSISEGAIEQWSKLYLEDVIVVTSESCRNGLSYVFIVWL